VAGWFWFSGRRALGYFADDTAVERASAPRRVQLKRVRLRRAPPKLVQGKGWG